MSLGCMVRPDDLVEVVVGKRAGKRGIVLRRTRARQRTYVRVQFVVTDQDGEPVLVNDVRKITFEELAQEKGVDPFELDWVRSQTPPNQNRRSYPIFSCPLCDRTIPFAVRPPERCGRCNWRKPSLLERMANAASSDS